MLINHISSTKVTCMTPSVHFHAMELRLENKCFLTSQVVMTSIDVHVSIFFYLVGWDLTPLGPFVGPLGSYKSQYCGHILAYCTFSLDDIGG
jgi:hypothetical protein